jgi:ribosomal protein S18 acetylase RimI-like enzyme
VRAVLKYRIVQIAEKHVASFHAALDSVARERKHLAMLKAPPLAETRKFIRGNIKARNVQLVALVSGDVVGWCDIVRPPRETMKHCGVLGLGVLSGYRGQHLGRELMTAAIARAWKRSISRIELTVREDNLPAINLYAQLGFEVEGLRRRALRVDGEYVNLVAMALLRDNAVISTGRRT